MSGNLVTGHTPGVLDDAADADDRTSEYALWDCMVAESDEIADIVHHDGAAELVPGMPPRPVWAHPDHDQILRDGAGAPTGPTMSRKHAGRRRSRRRSRRRLLCCSDSSRRSVQNWTFCCSRSGRRPARTGR